MANEKKSSHVTVTGQEALDMAAVAHLSAILKAL